MAAELLEYSEFFGSLLLLKEAFSCRKIPKASGKKPSVKTKKTQKLDFKMFTEVESGRTKT